MTRFVAAVVLLSLAAAAPATAADEEEPAPSIGGPVVTIPVDADQVSGLVVKNIILDPTTGLRAGDIVRLTATIATGVAPTRTALVIEGLREIEPDLPVGADGSIDHSFVVPDDLVPGRHDLTIRVAGLGAAPLGTLDVEQGPATTVEVEAETRIEPPVEPVEPVEPAAALQTDPPPVALDEPGPSSGFGWAVPLGLLAIAAAGALVVMGLHRRRAGEVPSVSRTASLPTATRMLARDLDSEADMAEPESPEPQGETAAEDLAEEPVDPVPVPAQAEAGAADLEPEEPVADAQPDAASPPLATPAPSFVVVELTELSPAAGDGDGDGDGDERIIGEFPTATEAKEAARLARSANDAAPPQEVWWEVRRAGGSAIWMIHAWAPREYDLETKSGEPRSAPTS